MPASASPFLSERVRLILADSPATLTINIVNAGIVAYVVRDAVPSPVPLLWFLFTITVVAARLVLLVRYRKACPRDGEVTGWARWVLVLVGLTGLAWGGGGVVMMSMAPLVYQVLLGCMLGGMASGGMPSLSRDLRIYLAFAVPVLVPACLYFAWLGTELTLSIAGLGLVLMLFLTLMARRQERFIVESLRVASENRELVGNLRHEIEEREQAEVMLRNREAALANAQRIAQLGSWEWDVAEGRITASEENRRLFGRDPSASDYDYNSFLATIHPDDRDRVDAVVQNAIRKVAPYSCDYRIRLPDGTERVIYEQADVSSDESGRAVRITGIDLDITERYRAQEQLRAAKQEAEAASAAKSEFLTNMSHELRTPLNAIIGYSEILKEDAEAQGAAEVLQDLDRINLAGRHLLELITEILDLSVIEAGRTELSFETISLRPFLEDIAATVQPLIAAKANSFVLDCPADAGQIYTDVTKLRQILYNLLSNASKFTENGQIRLEVGRVSDGPGPDDAQWVRFRVVDTGIGIAPEELKDIFKAFERAEAARGARYDGTGLGLAICRHYCEVMGGAISAESRPDEGSTFTVRMPAVAHDCRPARVN